MTKEEAVKKAKSFLSLQGNWDSYGARPICEEAVREAVRLLSVLGDGWTPAPCSDGGVQIERHVGGLDVEISITRAES